MPTSLLGTFSAIAPIFIIISLGWTARQSKLMPEEMWSGVNRLAFYMLAPMFMLDLITHADFSGAGAGQFVVVLMSGVLLMGGGALCMRPFVRNDPSFASIFQTAVRWNAIVLLAASPFLFGAQGTALVALAIAPMTIACNFLAVIGFSLWGGKGRLPGKSMLIAFALNPLLLGSLAATFLLVIGFRFPEPFASVVHQCGQASIALILLCVGAGLDFKAVFKAPGLMTAGTVLRLVWGPLAMLIAAEIWGLTGLTRAVAIAAGSTPTAAAGYVLAYQMGGDPKLMAGLITATTLLSAITIPLALAFLS